MLSPPLVSLAGSPTVNSGSRMTTDGQHLRVENDALHMGAVVGDHRSAPDFRAGPGRSRHRHHGRHAGHIDAQIVVADILEIPASGRSWPTISATALAASRAEPPPKAITPS